VHLGHAVDDADAAEHPHLAVPGRDAAVVGLAGLEVADVLALALHPRGRVHVDEVVGERVFERGPVAVPHGVETAVVGAEDFGLLGAVRHGQRSP
jgi:hypothetical protein